MQTTASLKKRPLSFSALNLAGSIFPSKPDLSEQYILDAARNSAGFNDWGSDSFLEGMRELLNSSIKEAKLHLFGRQFLQKGCIRAVKDRIRLQKAFQKNLEILNTPIEKPVFILGLPRTGTTFLQNLLFQNDHFRHLHYWEQVAVGPQPTHENLQDNYIIKSCVSFVDNLKTIAPEFFIAHEINPHGPEECNGLMERNFTSIIYFMFRNIPSYMEWFQAHDMTETYDYHKQQLQFLGYHFRKKQWVLKAPVHLFFLKYLFKTYPDAQIVHLHRDPLEVIPSMASLVVISRQIHSNHVNAEETANQILDWVRKIITNSIAFRDETNSDQFLDLAYTDLVKDPFNTLTQIYKWLGVDINNEIQSDISSWLENSKRKRTGKAHHYSLEQFNLTETKIQNEFNHYYDRYEDYV